MKDNKGGTPQKSKAWLDVGEWVIPQGELYTHPKSKLYKKKSCDDTEKTDNHQSAYNNEETSIEELLKNINEDYETYESVEDMINEPPHYATRHIQPNDYIDDLLDWNTALTPREGYYVGQIHRYLGRAGMKEGNAKMQDFKKAQYYMNRMIEKEG